MNNYYDDKLQHIITSYNMQCKEVLDSTYINSLIVKMFQSKCINKSIALWGAGRNNTITSHASVIMNRYISQLQGMVCLIDSAKEIQGKQMFGYPVIAPEDIESKNVELIIVASRASAESIKSSISRYAPECEVLDIYQELREQGINLYYNFYEEKSQYVYLYDMRKKYEESQTKEERISCLRELIGMYIKIRDFVYAFKYIREYIDNGYDNDLQMKSMYEEIKILLDDIKHKNNVRQGDITVYFVDSVRAMDVMDDYESNPEFKLAKKYFDNSLFFTNVYSTGPTTYESLIGILSEQYSYTKDVYADNFMFKVEEVPVLNRACNNDMEVNFYVSEEYKIIREDERVNFDNHIHMTEKLWKLATNKALSKKQVFSFAYIVWELHFPLLCGYLTNRPKIHGFYEVGLKDMSDYIEQQFRDCFDYVDKQFTFYEEIIHDKGYSVFFSDHSQVVYDDKHNWPFYKYYKEPEKQTHCILALQGPGIDAGVYSAYTSMIKFNQILRKYIYGDKIDIKEDEIVKYQYYNIHNPELRELAVQKGYTDYINGMNCFASREYVYMINIFGKKEVYKRDDLDNDISDTKEAEQFIKKVEEQFDTSFPQFLQERI